MASIGSEGDSLAFIPVLAKDLHTPTPFDLFAASPEDVAIGVHGIRAYSFVKRSRAFQAMMVVTKPRPSEVGGTDVDVYLDGRNSFPTTEVSVSHVYEAFDDLAFAMEPKYVLNLHLFNEGKKVLESLREFTRQEERIRLIWDETFLP
jgi:hypothetical protein